MISDKEIWMTIIHNTSDWILISFKNQFAKALEKALDEWDERTAMKRYIVLVELLREIQARWLCSNEKCTDCMNLKLCN